MHPTCAHFMDAWDGFRDGRLSETESRAVELHLTECENCRLRYRAVEGLSGVVRDVDLNPFVKRRIAVAAADFRRPLGAARWKKPLLRIGVPVVGTALLFLLAVLFRPTNAEKKVRGDSTPKDLVRTADARADETIQAAMFVDHARREIELFPGTSLYLSDDAMIETVELSLSSAHFSLLSGKVAVEIGGHEPNFRFVLQLPHGEAEARGTVFFADAAPNGIDEVQVLDGQVEVRGEIGTDSLVVSSSEAAVVKAGRVERSSELNLLTDDICLMKGCAPTQYEMSRVRKAEKTAPSQNAAESAIAEGRLDDAAQLVDDLSKDNSGRTSAVHLLSRLARAYRNAKKFNEAKGVYLRLIKAFPSTDTASDSLVALGQLEYSALGLPTEALSHFNRYLAENPSGFLAETATLEKIRVLQGQRMYRQVIAEADGYIANYKDTFTLSEVRRRRADALAQTGRCDEAIAEYRRVLTQWPGTHEAVRAEKGIVSCR